MTDTFRRRKESSSVPGDIYWPATPESIPIGPPLQTHGATIGVPLFNQQNPPVGKLHFVAAETGPGCGPRPIKAGAHGLPRPPHSGDRTQSLPDVSPKREYLRCRPETFGKIAPYLTKSGAWRPMAKLQ